MTSTRSSNPSHLIGLAGPTSLRLNRMDLPCSRCFLWLHAGGTNPGSTSDRSRCRGLRFRLPRYGIGSATPITIDFGAIFPFTSFRPTTSLSTLRSGRYRTPRKTRFAAARYALPRPPSQATEFNALARRNSHRTWRADFPPHALRQLVHSFHCYLFKFRFHGQLIFSLSRRP